jgi:hypothetical protein
METDTLFNDTFNFDIGNNDMDGNPDTPKFGFMGEATSEAIDPNVFDFLEDEEPFDISGFFTDMLVDMEPFDYLKPFDEFGKYYIYIYIYICKLFADRRYNRNFVIAECCYNRQYFIFIQA